MMKRDDWKKTTENMGGFKCIKHKITKELTLSGKYGDIWRYSDKLYAMVIKSRQIDSRARSLGFSLRHGLKDDESICHFPLDMLPKAVNLLKVSKQQATQIRYANSF